MKDVEWTWVLDGEEDDYLYCEGLGVVGLPSEADILAVEERWDGPMIRVTREHARLIAAAPDLLTALQRVLPWLEHEMPPAPDHICGPMASCDGLCMDYVYASEALGQVRKAIRKAGALLGSDDGGESNG